MIGSGKRRKMADVLLKDICEDQFKLELIAD
jgi:hypothetical protein